MGIVGGVVTRPDICRPSKHNGVLYGDDKSKYLSLTLTKRKGKGDLSVVKLNVYF